MDLPGGLTAPGAEPHAAPARQRPRSCSLTSARLRGAPHQGGGSTRTPLRRCPQRSAAPWPWDAPTLTPGGELGRHLPRPTRTGHRDLHAAVVPRPPDVVSRGAGLSAPRNTDKQGRTVHVLSGPVTGGCDGKADCFVGLPPRGQTVAGAARRGPLLFPAPRQAMAEAGRPPRPGESVARLRGAVGTQDNGGVLPSVSVRRSGDIRVWTRPREGRAVWQSL